MGFSTINVQNPLETLASTIADLPALERVIMHRLRGGLLRSASPVLNTLAGWEASFYQFDRSSAFQCLTREKQTEVLIDCSRQQIEEALLIEITGMTFAAKMALLAPNLQQRELYSHFAADEATHYRLLCELVGRPNYTCAVQNSFLVFLARMIQNSARLPLLVLIQVVLEGWGLSYYSQLAKHATVPEVRDALALIVDDEAAHHGSGLILMKDAQPNADDSQQMEMAITELVAMVKAGPARLVLSLAKTKGSLTKNEIRDFLLETSFEVKLKTDLDLVRHLLEKAGAVALVANLNAKNLFAIPTLSTCTDCLFSLQTSLQTSSQTPVSESMPAPLQPGSINGAEAHS